MPGGVVSCTNLDSVRVEVLGEGRSVTVPASLVLDIDRVLRRCLVLEAELDVTMVEDDDTGAAGWQARLDGGTVAVGDPAATPWGAIANLAKEGGR